MDSRDILDRLLRSLLQLSSYNKDCRCDHQSGVESDDRVRRIDYVMQNSLCVLWMTVAFVSLNHRGRQQQQGGSNQASWHFEINSEQSQERKYKARPASTSLQHSETARRDFTQIIFVYCEP